MYMYVVSTIQREMLANFVIISISKVLHLVINDLYIDDLLKKFLNK